MKLLNICKSCELILLLIVVAITAAIAAAATSNENNYNNNIHIAATHGSRTAGYKRVATTTATATTTTTAESAAATAATATDTVDAFNITPEVLLTNVLKNNNSRSMLRVPAGYSAITRATTTTTTTTIKAKEAANISSQTSIESNEATAKAISTKTTTTTAATLAHRMILNKSASVSVSAAVSGSGSASVAATPVISSFEAISTSTSTTPIKEKGTKRRSKSKQLVNRVETRSARATTTTTTKSKTAEKNQQKQQQQQHVAVILPSNVLKSVPVQQGFNNFVDFFQVDLKNINVDFLHDDGLSGLIQLLERPKYSVVVRTLNVGSIVDDGSNEGVVSISNRTSNSDSSSSSSSSGHDSQSESFSSGHQNPKKIQQNFAEVDEEASQLLRHDACYADDGCSCHLAEHLSQEYHKRVLLWPCSEMKESSTFLPSFEAISYAVQSIATKLNWTQVEIFVGDQNWGLPLAIAAHLQLPYTITIGSDARDLHARDEIGKAIIVTANMNDVSTLRLLRQLETLQYTKVLLIDMVATSFNAENRFYKNLARIEQTSQLMSNLLLLTVLSDKYRHFLSVAFDSNGIETLQNFRQMRRWRGANLTSEGPASAADWPMHLDSSVAQVLPMTPTPALSDLSDCALLPKAGDIHFADVCRNMDAYVSENCTQVSAEKAAALRATLQKLCDLYSPPDQQLTSDASRSQQKISDLRNFIDFFNFYDFLIASILHTSRQPSSPHVATRDENRANVPKYDFIVLDVVRGRRTLTTSGASSAEGDLNPDSSNSSGNGRNSNIHSSNDKDSNNNNNNNNHNNNTNKNINYATHNQHKSDNENHRATNNNNAQHNQNRSGTSFKWRPLLILEQHEINLNTYITHSILPGYDDWHRLVRTAQLTQCGAICWTLMAICMGVLLIIVAASVAAGIAMRNYYLRKRLSKGPNKIVLSASDFVFPVDSRRVDEGIEAMLCCWLQQLQEFGGPEVDKPDLLKGSIGSLKNLGLLIPGSTIPVTASGRNLSGSSSLARHNPALLDMRARYNGDLVQLKEVHLNGSMELKSKAMDLLVMAHGLRHENINPLIGWLSDPQRTAMVFDYCSRGSLQDVLIMDEIKLDWSFRLSLLTDLVRGMRYLHASSLRVHGALSSRNCVVDARWVLKITDYGLASFFEAQGLPQLPRSAKELLWTAPELLRSMKLHHQQHHGVQVVATQMGDVYSFGIIMQEVVVRGEPYCMLSLSAEEIIAKLKKPPPLIRPSVSKGAAPPEAINIMRQCWAEQPDMRPDFNSVYERFKMLNHGRKVNFVDTMFQMLEKYSNNLEELIRDRTDQLDIERKKTEQLLNRMLPSSVAEKLKMGLAVDPEEFSDVTIYFSDIVGFTTIAAHCSPVQVVDLLNDLYTIFDATINAYNVYKVETIGDAYMVVSGLPVKIPDHAEQIATMALDLLHQSGRFNVKHLPGVPLQLRIGLHTGPCCAGVVGLTMPRYCLFGDTVNTASRMESTGSSWRIHMSQETRDRLEARGGYTIEPRGLTDIKGKGMMNTFWLLGKKGFDKPLPAPPPIGESHGLDEFLIRNSITLKAQANKSRTSTNPSSSQSSSLAGESVEVKVEITPPTNTDVNSSILPNSYSLDSNSTNTISPNLTLCPDFPTKTPNASPQSRKFSELTPDSLLNPNSFNRLPNSTGGSSSRLYKKIEEIMDLSSPYNHYKCLSPSESNLAQFCGEGRYLYSGLGSGEGSTSSGVISCSGGGIIHSGSAKFDSKPGSSRLLRRQFSLDRDDSHKRSEAHHHQIHQSSLQTSHTLALTTKSNMLDIPVLQDTARSPKGRSMMHKQNSNSIAQDLEKIEEIPLSPSSSQQHSSLDSNLSHSPPSTVPSAETLLRPNEKPNSTRTVNSSGATSPQISVDAGLNSDTESTAAATVLTTNSTNNTISTEERNNIRKTELTLNVETLMTR